MEKEFIQKLVISCHKREDLIESNRTPLSILIIEMLNRVLGADWKHDSHLPSIEDELRYRSTVTISAHSHLPLGEAWDFSISRMDSNSVESMKESVFTGGG